MEVIHGQGIGKGGASMPSPGDTVPNLPVFINLQAPEC